MLKINVYKQCWHEILTKDLETFEKQCKYQIIVKTINNSKKGSVKKKKELSKQLIKNNFYEME